MLRLATWSILALALTAAAALLAQLSEFPPHMSSEAWAAWAQAILSAAAILVAFWLQDRQRRRDRADQGARETDVLWLAGQSLLLRAKNAAKHCHDQDWSKFYAELVAHALNEDLTMLRTVDIAALPDGIVRTRYYGFLVQGTRLSFGLAEILEGLPNQPRQNACDFATESMEEALQTIQPYLPEFQQ